MSWQLRSCERLFQRGEGQVVVSVNVPVVCLTTLCTFTSHRRGGYRSGMKRVHRSLLVFRPFLFRLCTVALGATLAAGCATTSFPPAPGISQDDPDSFEKAAFDVLCDYYCAQKKWPTVWSALATFQRERGADATWLEEVKDPEVSSPRAIFLSLKYTSGDGVTRRANYIAPPRCSGGPEKGLVEVAAEGVVFKLPEGFELMATKDVQARWKSPPYPDAAWSAADGRVLALRFGELEIEPDELPNFAVDMAQAYEASISSLRWIFKDVKVISGKPVLYHEFQSTASTGPIVNAVFSGAFDRRLFAITITGSTERADAVRQAARQVEQSLQIR